MDVWTRNESILTIPLNSIIVEQANYPDNCYTLDLSNNEDIKEKGLKEIDFKFKPIADISVDLMVEGKTLACNREIKNNIFYFSGPDIKLKDLGKIHL